jgi:hypothetical protein
MAFDETPLTDVIKAFAMPTGANTSPAAPTCKGRSACASTTCRGARASRPSLTRRPAARRRARRFGHLHRQAKTDVIPKITKTFDLKQARADEVTNLVVRLSAGTRSQAVGLCRRL